jgi:hypothetical protein
MSMRSSLALMVVSAATALVACNGKNKNEPGGPSQSPTITEDDHGKCARESASQINTCDPATNVCHLMVGMDKSGKPFVEPYTLLAAGGTESKKTIVWHLLDVDLEFKETHGPQAWNRPGQFKDGQLTDDFDGAMVNPAPSSARHYRITYLGNEEAGPSKKHTYKIKVRQGNRVHVCDPIIINSDAN